MDPVYHNSLSLTQITCFSRSSRETHERQMSAKARFRRTIWQSKVPNLCIIHFARFTASSKLVRPNSSAGLPVVLKITNHPDHKLRGKKLVLAQRFFSLYTTALPTEFEHTHIYHVASFYVTSYNIVCVRFFFLESAPQKHLFPH